MTNFYEDVYSSIHPIVKNLNIAITQLNKSLKYVSQEKERCLSKIENYIRKLQFKISLPSYIRNLLSFIDL